MKRAADVLGRHARLDLAQEAYGWLFAKTLLHVQSFSREVLNSKPGHYGIWRGRRAGLQQFVIRQCVGRISNGSVSVALPEARAEAGTNRNGHGAPWDQDGAA